MKKNSDKDLARIVIKDLLIVLVALLTLGWLSGEMTAVGIVMLCIIMAMLVIVIVKALVFYLNSED